MAAQASSSAPRKPANLREHLAWLGSRRRLLFALAVAMLVFFLPVDLGNPFTHLLATWDAFALTTLALCWIAMTHTQQSDIREKARTQDSGTTVIFVALSTAASASLAAVAFLLHSAKEPSHFALHVAVSGLAVLSAWALLHTMFALHYAHSFYGDSGEKDRREHAKGLDFPGDEEPDYLDFAYYSFVVGMTFQVSDVDITSRHLRRLTLVHSLLSFVFNTLIIALSINTVSSLLQ